MESVNILGLKIDRINIPQVIEKIVSAVVEGKKLKIFHLNIHAFNVAFKDERFKKVLNGGDIVFCDGFGVKLGASILGLSIGQRMTPPDWIDELCQALVQNNQTLFLIGDEEGIAERCALKLAEQNKGLKIVGTHHGFFDKHSNGNDAVIELINKAEPDVILVGFGMPLQEKWIAQNYNKLNAKAFIAVGAMFKWIAGEGKRAPAVLASNGFEGVWRLVTQPRKVWKRYIIEVPVFFLKIVSSGIAKKYKR